MLTLEHDNISNYTTKSPTDLSCVSITQAYVTVMQAPCLSMSADYYGCCYCWFGAAPYGLMCND